MAKRYIYAIWLVAAMSLAGLAVISFRFDPYESDAIIRALFLFAIFFFIWSAATTLLYYIMREPAGGRKFFTGFRRGFFFSLIVLVLIICGRYNTGEILLFSLISAIIMIEFLISLVLRRRNIEKENLWH